MTPFKLLVPLLFTLTFLSCKKETPPAPIILEYVGEIADYAYFKKGTWWVYEIQPWGVYDTIEVFFSSRDTTVLEGGGKKMIYENFVWKGQSKRDNYIYECDQGPVLPNPEYLSLSGLSKYVCEISKSRPGNYGGASKVFFKPFNPEIIAQSGTHETSFIDSTSQIEIAGNTYTSCKTFQVSSDATFIWDHLGRSGGTVNYIWAKNKGIIRKEHTTKNITWELIESHIVQ